MSPVGGTLKWLGTTLCLALGLLSQTPFVYASTPASRCAVCHPSEVAGYSRSAMAHSLRRSGKEPEGSFVHAVSGTKFTIYSNKDGLWQRMERDGDVSEYHVEYVVGSGNHAAGYLVLIGNQLFQSPICYYSRLNRYDMAPGYEEYRAPDFIRAVSEACLLCHSGKPLRLKGTLNEYPSPAFAQESISCDRCHGDPTKHLKAPLPGSIVNPAKLSAAGRNSVCEQCHLKGVVRVLNPGKQFVDFHPGVPLEQVFTIYTASLPPDSPEEGLKVVSHSEQLALSLCSRMSNGHLWCATCHNPHDQARQPPQYYRARCMTCHAGKLAKSHPGGSKGNCVSCHMAKLDAKDGGHTVFTDHRISRNPQADHQGVASESNDLVPWREPQPALRERNLALAYANAGLENESMLQGLQGYRLLLEVQKQFPDDPEVLTSLGRIFLMGRQSAQAAELFEQVLRLGWVTAANEMYAGRACLQAGQTDKAIDHLEQALKLDPLLLPAAESLMQVYRQQGDEDKISALSDHVRQALGYSAPHAVAPPDH